MQRKSHKDQLNVPFASRSVCSEGLLPPIRKDHFNVCSFQVCVPLSLLYDFSGSLFLTSDDTQQKAVDLFCVLTDPRGATARCPGTNPTSKLAPWSKGRTVDITYTW